MAAGLDRPSGEDSPDYVLGTDAPEADRLRQQHALWQPQVEDAWNRAGLSSGHHVLDLGAGPGFGAVELARRVGPAGRVLALEHSATYVASARAAAKAAGVPWLEVRRHDLSRDPLEECGFDFAWCRWVAMFLPELKPLVTLLSQALAPGGVLVAHEYVHWDSFALHPHGEAIGRFARACRQSFAEAGGDPDPNRGLPTRLAAAGFRIEELRPLPVIGRPGDAWAAWLERFVTNYSPQLIRMGLWSDPEALATQEEIDAARQVPGSYGVGPTVLELRARREPCP